MLELNTTEALRLCLFALNEIPNKRLKHVPGIPDTYKLASAITRTLNNQKEETKMEQTFPNGFTSWIETFYITAAFITEEINDSPRKCNIRIRHQTQGTSGLFELAQDWTNEFERLHEGNTWDGGDWFDTLEAFLVQKNMEDIF